MEDNYKKQIQLRCHVCGDNSSFEFNEEKIYVKCSKCGKEYFDGYNELMVLNQELINGEIENIKQEVSDNLKNDITQMLKDTFKGSKSIKIK